MTNNSNYSAYGAIGNGIGSYLHVHHIIQREELYTSHMKCSAQPKQAYVTLNLST